jgi:hypothetical protein
MTRFLLLAFTLLGLLCAPLAAAAQQPLPRINPLTGKPFSQASRDAYEAELRQIAEEERMAMEVSEKEAKRFEELRRRNAPEIGRFQKAMDDWRAGQSLPPGAAYSKSDTSLNDDVLPEDGNVTFYNSRGYPTHVIHFGRDGRPTGPLAQTQQGKAWETIGPRLPPGGSMTEEMGRDFDGESIIEHVEIHDAQGRLVARYDFNFEGIAWRGETFDPETGLRNGAFQDDSRRPPELALGGPLAEPPSVRSVTGICEPCRALANELNDYAARINLIAAEMRSLSAQNQRSYQPAQKAILARYNVLAAQLPGLMARYEALLPRVVECLKQCRAAEDAAREEALARLPDPRPPQGPGEPAIRETSFTPGQGAIPGDNKDLQQVIDLAQAYLAAANCEGMQCPVCDCDQAREALQALSDMEAFLQAMEPYMAAANADHFAQFKTAAENGIINGQQRDRTIRAIGLHQAYHNFGSMLLDVASIGSWIKETLQGDGLETMSPVELLDKLDSWYEASKDLESLLNTAGESVTGEEQASPVADLIDREGIDKDFYNDAASTIADAKSIITAALKSGKDWRAALKKEGAAAALGQIAGRYLKAYSVSVLKERQQALDELLRDAEAGDLLQGRAYLDLARVQQRRAMLEDALAAVRAAKAAYVNCAYRACGPFTLSRPRIPNFVEDVPGGRPKLSWGKALPWFNKAIAETAQRMEPATFHEDCPKPKEDDGPRTAPDPVPVTDAVPTPPKKKPCPPKHGRDPITVGPNSRVGTGAQLRSRVGGMALGALAGALGGGGGGGGGSEGPQLWTCKIKDSEFTLFEDPVSGVSLQVAAKRVKGGKLVIFSRIARSPDKGTFQTAFLERPSTGETIAPSDVGPCDLWGEWKLTVSWTKSTYVDGQLVKQESGGWSEGGFFKIPGTLSRADAPDGLWRRMGFSSATAGARQIGAIFDAPPGGGPLTFVVHVTRPRGDPVTTVPFVLTLTEGADGLISFARYADEPCPPETTPATTVARPDGPPPSTPTAPPSTPPAPPATTTRPPSPPAPSEQDEAQPVKYITAGSLRFIEAASAKSVEAIATRRRALDETRCQGPTAWEENRQKLLKYLRDELKTVRALDPTGPDKEAIASRINGELARLADEIAEVEALTPPAAPPGAATPETCPADGGESILDSIEEVWVPA